MFGATENMKLIAGYVIQQTCFPTHFSGIIFTDCVCSTKEGNVFSLFTPGGGVGYPGQVQMGGGGGGGRAYPSQV